MDYDNASPKQLREWKKEYRKKCRQEMKSYLKRFPDATAEERQDLREWVNSGHSPYENGDYISTEYGEPMDFITARRFLEAVCQEYLKDPVKFQSGLAESDDVIVDPDSELPF